MTKATLRGYINNVSVLVPVLWLRHQLLCTGAEEMCCCWADAAPVVGASSHLPLLCDGNDGVKHDGNRGDVWSLAASAEHQSCRFREQSPRGPSIRTHPSVEQQLTCPCGGPGAPQRRSRGPCRARWMSAAAARAPGSCRAAARASTAPPPPGTPRGWRLRWC